MDIRLTKASIDKLVDEREETEYKILSNLSGKQFREQLERLNSLELNGDEKIAMKRF